MSAKKGRRAKVPTGPRHENQKVASNDSPNLSAIERASFLEGLQQNHGNPLHSTALEEDLDVPQEGRMNGGTAKTTVKRRAAAVKRRSDGGTSQRTAARPATNQQKPKGDKKRGSDSGSGRSERESQEKSARKKVLLSSSEGEDGEDTSWCPAPKQATVQSLGRARKSSSDKSRKSSSGGASAEPERKRMRKKRVGRGRTQLEVVLDAFLAFCDQDRESVESKSVQQSIDSFSSNVEEHLLEKISSAEEFKVLKRENAKVGSSIRTKTQRLFDAKHELMRAEREVWLKQKEKAELKVRLADLRRGRTFLSDLRDLQRRYLEDRRARPSEKETYGASSLAALLLQTKTLRSAEGQTEEEAEED